mgnify:CR=1 FL=1
MNGGSGANTITEKFLPDFAEGSVKIYVKRAWNMADPDSGNYSLSTLDSLDTYAEWNANEQDGIDALATRADNGSSIVQKGIDLLEDIFDGSKLNANTKLDDAYTKKADILKQQLTEEILPNLESEVLSIGMLGSSGHNILQAKAAEKILTVLIDTSKDIYFDDYEIARDIQENSLGHGIVYGSESARNAELLRQAGLYIREYNQGNLEDAYRRWLANQIHAITKLEILGNAIRATIGSGVTKTEPFYRPKPIAQLAGLAMAGAGLFASFYKGTTPVSNQYSPGTFGMANIGVNTMESTMNPTALGLPNIGTTTFQGMTNSGGT